MDVMDTNLQRRLRIGECLLELMRSTSFQRITVAEICNHLGIAHDGDRHFCQLCRSIGGLACGIQNDGTNQNDGAGDHYDLSGSL